MGTIIERPRTDGTIAYLAKISIMREGVIVLSESRTFDRRPAAKQWLKNREGELAKPGALERAGQTDPLLSVAIDRYIAESEKAMGKTKAQVLRTIKSMPIAAKKCSAIDTEELCNFAKSLKDAQPSTRGNYLSHLSSIFAIAKPMWKYPLDRQAMADAQVVLKKLGIISKSNERDRRPTLDELDKIMEHFGRVEGRRASAPMQKIIVFAIFSTRRQDEISRLLRSDREPGRVMVRDMKHPGDKIGNDTWCDLVPEAEAVLDSLPEEGKTFFDASADAISAAFTRACKLLNIEDLHFHDLRHEGISRLFEMGWTIPKAASVSGHRSWQSLQRYSHLRQTGDKYANWKWKIT